MRGNSWFGQGVLWHLEIADAFDDWPTKSCPFTLRFRDPSLEVEFTQQRVAELSAKLFVTGSCILCLCVCFLVVALGFDEARTRSLSVDIQWRRYVALCVLAFSAVVTMAFTRTPRWLERARPVVSEIATVFGLLLLVLVVFCMDPYYIAKLHGIDPAVAWADPLRKDLPLVFQDSRLLLILQCILSASHLLLPIRFCVLWPLGCFCVGAYICVIVGVGSPDIGNVGCNLALLAASSLIVLFAKRRSECCERYVFASHCSTSLTHDTFEAEVPLTDMATPGQCAESGAVIRPMTDECSVTSVPTTTHTGRMFAALERVDAEVRWKLEKIAEVGHKERWLIEAASVRLMPDQILGSGSFGVVLLASLHGSRVAVKVPKSSVHGSTAWHLPSLGNELRILRHVRHPNVVLFHGACIDPTSSELALVLEYVQGQRLDRFLETVQPSETARHSILIDICCALRYLHGQRPCVVHGDLKASNILVEDCGVGRPRPKLVDFGLSRLLTRKAKPLGGTLNWMAPELLQNPGMSPAPSADVFSFGRLAFFATTGVRPLVDVDKRTLVKLARQARLPPLMWPENTPFLRESQQLVDRCLEIDASLRPQMDQVHQELGQWRISTDDGTSSCSQIESAERDDSLSWRSGLRMVREALRPVPPNRSGSAPASMITSTVAAVEAESPSGDMAQSKTMKWERPLPPPRSQGQPRVRPGLPNIPAMLDPITRLPPLMEVGAEGTTEQSTTPVSAQHMPREYGSSESDSGPLVHACKPIRSRGANVSALRAKALIKAAELPATLVMERFQETPTAMMEISVLDALQRWNFPRSVGSCCVWHAALSRLKDVHRGLKHRSCDWGFALVSDWQCPRCFHMDQLDDEVSADDKECDLCGYDPALERDQEDDHDEEGEEEEEDGAQIEEESGESDKESARPDLPDGLTRGVGVGGASDGEFRRRHTFAASS